MMFLKVVLAGTVTSTTKQMCKAKETISRHIVRNGMIMLTADSIATHGNHMKKIGKYLLRYLSTFAQRQEKDWTTTVKVSRVKGWSIEPFVKHETWQEATSREDKVIRSNAWAQRHAVDLDAPKNSDADNDEFPGAGAVAHYLWGINPLNPQPARDWFERKANQIKDERGLFSFHRAKTEYFANIPGMEDNKVETRRINVNEFELRAGPTGEGMSFTGYAAVFNSDSEPLPFIERITPGAFRKSLKGRNTIKMYMNHDSSMLLASTRSKTLRLEEDSRGLLVNADLPDTTVGRDLSVLMQRGDVDSMSFGFSVPSGGDKWSDDGMTRELRQVRLHEVSVVTGFPAYKATSATVRSLDMLAERTGVDADKLAEAITMLESGNTLSDESAELLSSAVSKLRAEPAQVPHAVNLLAKKLELLKKF
jgi:uncharacterized protein